MKYIRILTLTFLLLLAVPALAAADETQACTFGLFACDADGVVWGFDMIGAEHMVAAAGLTEYIITFGYFLNGVIVPFIMAIAVLFFVWNAVRYFFLEPANSVSHDKAKKHALYGIGAFVFILSLWGIVNLLVDGSGLDRQDTVCPDYLGDTCGEDIDFDRELEFRRPSKKDEM